MNEKQKNTGFLKRKLLAAVSMLLVSTILMTATSYAWLVLSVAPEVTGITTNVGANGALEIVLLTTETRENLDLIRTSTDLSLKGRNPAANNTWGNLVDVSYAEYGLSDIMLMPSRLRVSANAETYSVESNLLSVPVYGYDGRIEDLTDNTLSAIRKSGKFSLVMGQQDFGVRAIGVANDVTVQGSALALAKSDIKTYTKSAQNAAIGALSNYGDDLFSIVFSHALDAQKTYTDADKEVLNDLLNTLQNSLNYIDLSLRQGIVAYAASEISDEDTFIQMKDQVMDTSKSLLVLMNGLDMVQGIPQEYKIWINAVSDIQNDLNAAKNANNNLSGNQYTWSEIREVLNYIMNVDKVYINDTIFSEFDTSNADNLLGGSVTLTLAPQSGVFADIAAFVGNYASSFSVMGTNIETKTAYTGGEPYLNVLSNVVDNLQAADNSTENQKEVSLSATYGYALDLAFRCNAVNPDLLLQTTPENRIYEDSAGSTMGGGSYMEFSTKDSGLSLDKMTRLMDAIRVAFVDDQNVILGIAKLNTSNRAVIDDVINAPLYLYDFSISGNDGSIVMGERRLGENLITELTQNVAKAVTAVVWLDGDIVDNTMVSAAESASLNGVLNLQFATSADLIPAGNSELMNVTADKTQLSALLTEKESVAKEGQGTYTTVSWNDFTTAYKFANAVNNNPNANDNQVYTAAYNLTVAAAGLEGVSKDALSNKIREIRDLMGTSENVARYVIKNEDGSYAAVGHEEHTQKTHDGWDIVGEVFQVNYDKNLNDEGNDIKTQIYTDASWAALAAVLYEAEATLKNDKATDGQVNAALTALDTAHQSLQRRVFYSPYEYNGNIYYEAICNANDEDTYGKWYDSEFKRIVADITILNLDAYAKPVEIAKINQEGFVPLNVETLTPTIEILDEVYPELRDEEIKGANWSAFDVTFFREIMDQRHINTLNTLIGVAKDEDLAVDTSAAEDLLKSKNEVYLDNAKPVIEKLNADVTAALEAKRQNEIADNSDITSSQRILLTTAINTAKNVEILPKDDSEDAKTAAQKALEDLNTAIGDAEKELAKEDPFATKEEAEQALDKLNAELKKAGQEEVTEYNTLTHSLPVISEIYEVAYPIEFPGVKLARTKVEGQNYNKNGKTTIGCIVVTSNGVVIKLSKEVTFYAPAEKVEICESEDVTLNNISLTTNGQKDVMTKLSYIEDYKDILEKETPVHWTWASENKSVATVAMDKNGTCTISARQAGNTKVTVSVETKEGNIYTAEIQVTIS